MKTLKTILLTLIPFLSYSQLYITPSFGTNGEKYVRTELEIRESFIILQGSYQTNFNDKNNLQLKLGFGYNYNDFGFYAYLPYMNYSLEETGYSTPLCAEFFYKKAVSLNVDVYKNVVVPSLRFKIRIL